jgi:molybdopterin converting factor small subunit
MIRVKVYSGTFSTSGIVDEDGYALVEEDTTVGEILKRLGCPRIVVLAGLYMVNHRRTRMDTKLKDGDVLSIMTPPSGG